ncbi:extra-cytoplasmic Solute Receptor [Cupriavidus basilensis OR16]|uniref:Extra-cytoplasmic Solute Receptor n=2 Tax=Cupriavidus basilensis TaxID=68895 RepID=H1S620_9BURK|nr:extra-cytoplasmic Solute Receptor [Cupriavidus basilensis OR16]
MLKSLTTTLALAIAAGPASVNASGLPYPSRPITFVLPYPAGGASDSLTRAMAEEMGKKLGQPVIVENRPGAAGAIGTNYAAKAPADGYTVLVTLTQSILNNQLLFSKLPYDTRKDLAFISELFTGNVVLVVNQSLPVKNVKELLEYCAQNKGTYGSWGIGSYAHLAGSFLGQSRNLNLTHVPYKGEAPELQDIIGGQLTFAFGSIGGTRPFVAAGKLRALAVSGEQRMKGLPNVPTFAEAGLNGLEFKPNGSVVMMAPIATPAPILARLEQEARAAVDTPPVRARLQTYGLEPLGTDARRARENYDALYPVQERLIKLTGAKLD